MRSAKRMDFLLTCSSVCSHNELACVLPVSRMNRDKFSKKITNSVRNCNHMFNFLQNLISGLNFSQTKEGRRLPFALKDENDRCR